MRRSLKAVISWVMDALHFSRCLEPLCSSPGVEAKEATWQRESEESQADLFSYYSSQLNGVAHAEAQALPPLTAAMQSFLERSRHVPHHHRRRQQHLIPNVQETERKNQPFLSSDNTFPT